MVRWLVLPGLIIVNYLFNYVKLSKVENYVNYCMITKLDQGLKQVLGTNSINGQNGCVTQFVLKVERIVLFRISYHNLVDLENRTQVELCNSQVFVWCVSCYLFVPRI